MVARPTRLSKNLPGHYNLSGVVASGKSNPGLQTPLTTHKKTDGRFIGKPHMRSPIHSMSSKITLGTSHGLVVIMITLCLLMSLRASASGVSQPGTGIPAKVLAPEQFKYPTRLGYTAAESAPEVMKKLFCYCGCDRTDQHSSLLDCFTSIHGAYCAICQEEAIEASRCKARAMPIGKIQSQIDQHYAKRYPFPRPSEKLIKYRQQLKASGVPVAQLPVLAASKNRVHTQQSRSCCRQ